MCLRGGGGGGGGDTLPGRSSDKGCRAHEWDGDDNKDLTIMTWCLQTMTGACLVGICTAWMYKMLVTVSFKPRHECSESPPECLRCECVLLLRPHNDAVLMLLGTARVLDDSRFVLG